MERVKVARMPLEYSRIFPRKGYEFRGSKLVFRRPLASAAVAAQFVQRMNSHGFKAIGEMTGGASNLIMIAALANAPQDVITLDNGQISADVVPILGGRVLRLTDVKTGKHVTAHNATKSIYFPFCGGMESQVGDEFRYYGWVEPARLIASSATSVKLSIATTNGLTLVRELSLIPGKPVMKVKETLTNPKTSTVRVRFRSQLELNLGSLTSTRTLFKTVDGTARNLDLSGIIKGLRLGQRFRRGERPDGSWTFTGDSGLKVIQRFDKDKIDHTWVFAYPKELGQVNTQIWATGSELKAGESKLLEFELEIAR